jgi:hypothetical protein
MWQPLGMHTSKNLLFTDTDGAAQQVFSRASAFPGVNEI